MKHIIITNVVFLLLVLKGLNAQETITSSGSEARGPGGTSNYTIGQVVYTTATGPNGSVVQGVQQPFTISTTIGINKASINLEMKVSPNPTTNFLSLKVEGEKLESLTYQLFDLQGKVIKSKKAIESTTIIIMKELPKATYFLKVNDNTQTLKTFKIIKN